MSDAYWPTGVSCFLANQWQLLIDHFTSIAHWATKVSCMLANLRQLLIGQLMPAAHWPSYISCSLANITSAVHWPTNLSCSLANLHQPLISQPMSAALWQTEMLIGKPHVIMIKFNSKTLKLCLPRGNAAERLLLVSCMIWMTSKWQMQKAVAAAIINAF